jgi:hypothetical protein
MTVNISTPIDQPNATIEDAPETVDRVHARWAVAFSSVAGASAGVLLGILVGMRMHSEAARVQHRITSTRDAWDLLRG